MFEIVLISILLIGCLVACWAIFHVKKQKKNKKQTKKEDVKVEEKKEEAPKPIEDIKLTKNQKLKIVKSAVLQPKVERVYEKKEEKTAEEEPVVVIRSVDVKPKKAVSGNTAKSIERVFSGKNESKKEEIVEEIKPKSMVPNRTPSIADRIEFREHLAEIYGGFGTGINPVQNKSSTIEQIQNEEMEESTTSTSFTDIRNSSMFSGLFSAPETNNSSKKNIKNLTVKDMVLAEAIMKRPKLSKNLKNFNKK